MKLLRCDSLLLIGVLLVPSLAHGQFQTMPTQGMQGPTGPTNCNAQLTAPVNVGYVPPTNYNPGYYGNPYVYSPAGSYLSGLADLTNANGQYLQQVQQSRILQNQADTGKLDVRKQIWEHDAWERKNTPTAEQVRAYEAKIDLQRARNNPPLNYVWSGDAMNTLMVDIQRMHAAGLSGPPVVVDPNVLRQIGVTDGGSRGGIELLLNNGKLTWPFTLRKGVFTAQRNRVNDLCVKVVEQARGDGVDPDTVDALQKAVKSMGDQVRRMQEDDLTPSQAIEAKRYLGQLDGAFKTLADPNVANYFNGKWSARGDTVGEVVNYLQGQGLRFAPCVGDNQAAYTAFYSSMVTYDLRLASMVATR